MRVVLLKPALLKIRTKDAFLPSLKHSRFGRASTFTPPVKVAAEQTRSDF